MFNHWNYRIVKHTEKDWGEWYAIHEVYYKEDKLVAISEKPIAAIGDSLEELVNDFSFMKKAFKKPILNYEDF